MNLGLIGIQQSSSLGHGFGSSENYDSLVACVVLQSVLSGGSLGIGEAQKLCPRLKPGSSGVAVCVTKFTAQLIDTRGSVSQTRACAVATFSRGQAQPTAPL